MDSCACARAVELYGVKAVDRSGFDGREEEDTMRTQAFAVACERSRGVPRRAVMRILLILLAGASPALAQSFLGTHPRHGRRSAGQRGGRGRGPDRRRSDRRSPATLDTDCRRAATRPPTSGRAPTASRSWRTTSRSSRETGVLVRAAGTALVDVTLEVGGVNETVTVSGEAANNITLDSQAISRGLDEQQLHDLPRSSRDIQSFLLLNPNVVGGSRHDIQFLGAKTYGVSYIQDGQASTNAIFGTVGNSAPGLDAVSEMQVLSNSYSAEYGGLAGVVVTTKRGGQQYRGTASSTSTATA